MNFKMTGTRSQRKTEQKRIRLWAVLLSFCVLFSAFAVTAEESGTEASDSAQTDTAEESPALKVDDDGWASTTRLSDEEDDPEDGESEVTEDSLQSDLEEAKQEEERLKEEEKVLTSADAKLQSALAVQSKEILSIQKQMSDTDDEIKDIQQRIDETQTAEAGRRSILAGRVKMIYEQGNPSWLDIFLTSESFPRFLNHVEYVRQMNAYDERLMAEIVQLQDELKTDEAELLKKQDQLADTGEKLQKEQEKLEELLELAGGARRKKKDAVAKAEASVSRIEQRIEAFEQANEAQAAANAEERLSQIRSMAEADGLSGIEQRATAEQTAGRSDLPSWMQLAEGARTGTWTVSAMDYTEEELNAMAAIIYCEARGEPYVGKVAVASVILNRVRSSRFAASDIISVIRAPKQFEPVSTGHFDEVLSWAAQGQLDDDTNYQECRSASLEALNGTRTTNLCFFWAVWLADRHNLPGLDIGGHRFFGWITQDW